MRKDSISLNRTGECDGGGAEEFGVNHGRRVQEKMFPTVKGEFVLQNLHEGGEKNEIEFESAGRALCGDEAHSKGRGFYSVSLFVGFASVQSIE